MWTFAFCIVEFYFYFFILLLCFNYFCRLDINFHGLAETDMPVDILFHGFDTVRVMLHMMDTINSDIQVFSIDVLLQTGAELQIIFKSTGNYPLLLKMMGICIFPKCTVVLSTSEKIAYMYTFKIMFDTSVIQ